MMSSGGLDIEPFIRSTTSVNENSAEEADQSTSKAGELTINKRTIS